MKIKQMMHSAMRDAKQMKQELSGVHKHKSTTNKKIGSKINHSKDSGKNKEQTQFENQLGGAIVTEKPNVKWEDVAGLETAKRSLQEAIILPAKFPDIFVGLRKPWKGILLYGVR